MKHDLNHTINDPTGKPVSHQFAKELLAGFAGAEVVRYIPKDSPTYADLTSHYSGQTCRDKG
jgi:hypothetical protein